MKLLISNDDGIEARGIRVLAESMRELGTVTIVAPDKNRSGASNSLTLDAPIRIKKLEDDVYRLSGTPTDCVHIALTGLLESDPDIVVSGINAGANLGDGIALFEPTHGSAPKYKGLNKVNPMAMMLSGKLMLEHLGEIEAAQHLEKAIADVIKEGKSVTYDMKPTRDDPTAVGTSQVADAIIEKLLHS